ncbi:MAG: acyl-CoA thioesterase YciA [Oceanicoccus sp.]|jgi:acyl-CoA thioesterase YciA
MNDIDFDTDPTPTGDLALQVVALPSDTNAFGDIYGGWLVSQMDVASSITAMQIAKGRVATVAINGMALLTPVHVGAVVSCYTDVIEVGRSSIRINVEVWIKHKVSFNPIKVTEGGFVVVSLDSKGRPQSIPGQ